MRSDCPAVNMSIAVVAPDAAQAQPATDLVCRGATEMEGRSRCAGGPEARVGDDDTVGRCRSAGELGVVEDLATDRIAKVVAQPDVEVVVVRQGSAPPVSDDLMSSSSAVKSLRRGPGDSVGRCAVRIDGREPKFDLDVGDEVLPDLRHLRTVGVGGAEVPVGVVDLAPDLVFTDVLGRRRGIMRDVNDDRNAPDTCRGRCALSCPAFRRPRGSMGSPGRP